MQLVLGVIVNGSVAGQLPPETTRNALPEIWSDEIVTFGC
jgi:hypothetical protein